MKRLLNWQILLGLFLIALATAVYFIHFLIFRDAHHIFIYLIGDIAFVFFEVLLVTLVLHQLLHSREKQALLKKLNMIIGAFFSEVGTELIRIFSVFDPHSTEVAKRLIVKNNWSDKKFRQVKKDFHVHECNIECKRGNLTQLRDFLITKLQNFLINKTIYFIK